MKALMRRDNKQVALPRSTGVELIKACGEIHKTLNLKSCTAFETSSVCAHMENNGSLKLRLTEE